MVAESNETDLRLFNNPSYPEDTLKVEMAEFNADSLNQSDSRRGDGRGRPKKQTETLEWSEEATEALIKLWQSKEELYNRQHPYFYVREYKDRALESIRASLEHMGFNVSKNQISGKFQSLRTYFCTQRTKKLNTRKRYSTGVMDDDFECKWRFYKSLQFLDDNMKPRDTAGKKNHHDELVSVNYDRSILDIPKQSEIHQVDPRRQLDPACQNSFELSPTSGDSTPIQFSFKNEDHLFGELVGNMVSQIPTCHRKDLLKLEIQQLIIRAKYSGE